MAYDNRVKRTAHTPENVSNEVGATVNFFTSKMKNNNLFKIRFVFVKRVLLKYMLILSSKLFSKLKNGKRFSFS